MIDKEFQKKALQERIDWVAGRLILAIGSGDFKQELSLMVQFLEANAYDRGLKARGK